jgi:hypothetical protein
MKTFSSILLLAMGVMVMVSCDHQVSMETTVHPDGALDKTIILEASDSSRLTNNFLGISTLKGWRASVEKKQDVKGSSNELKAKKNLLITFHKTFNSAEEANSELTLPSDTLFRVKSQFDKRFRWFYTYLRYSDTYQAINRLAHPTDDYFTAEDYAFIDRLPAEGSPISKADSIYLSDLNKKIYDVYGSRAIYEDFYKLLENLLTENKVDQHWIDSLQKSKEHMYAVLLKQKDMENDFMLKIADSLGIPKLSQAASEQYMKEAKAVERKVDYMSEAGNGTYSHKINMPWEVVRSNADSVAGKELFWRPSTTKFLLKGYTMYAESRKMNYWAILVSAIIVIGTGVLMVRKRKVV